MSQLNVEDLHWLVGFIEAEGSFMINIVERGKGISCQPLFQLSITEDDKETVEKMRSSLGFGRIQKRPSKYWIAKGMGNARDQYAYIVNGLTNAIRFINIFNPNLFRTTKKRAYLLWIEAVQIIKSYEHLKYNGLLRLCEIRDTMNKEHKQRQYKNKEWFIRFLESKMALFTEEGIRKRMELCRRGRKHFEKLPQQPRLLPH